MRVNLTCPVCGTTFDVHHTTVERRRYCSKACQSSGVEQSNRVPLVIVDGVAQVPLYRKDRSVRAYALVDAADADRVGQYRWHIGSGGYPAYSLSRSREGKNPAEIKLHRFLMGLELGDPMQVDHINRNRLDNRRSNLRLVIATQQLQNKSSHRGSTSKYRGVHRVPDGRWVASIRVGGKLKHLGLFVREEDAATVAQEARLRLMPFAVD
jgi:hypothetical protein